MVSVQLDEEMAIDQREDSAEYGPNNCRAIIPRFETHRRGMQFFYALLNLGMGNEYQMNIDNRIGYFVSLRTPGEQNKREQIRNHFGTEQIAHQISQMFECRFTFLQLDAPGCDWDICRVEFENDVKLCEHWDGLMASIYQELTDIDNVGDLPDLHG
ncbi:hypothetical protein niasHS_001885 [Heterodera schachtii]|uniref:Uncharacterized protein n=2 Tax=Heterodera TaxID=34509 RepID=A0ABD2KAL7_HETSC